MALTRVNPNGPGLQQEVRSFRVLALDPGGSTGWAYAQYIKPLNAPPVPAHHAFRFECGQLGPHEHHEELDALLHHYYFAVQDPNLLVPSQLDIVCESFEFRQHIDKNKAKMKVELISKEYIGVTKLFAVMNELPLTFQTASAGKGLIPDTGPQKDVKIKQLGWYVPGSVHAMDATRHLIYYLVRKLKIVHPFTDVWLNN